MTSMFFDTMRSPVGELLLAANNDGLTHVLFTPLHDANRITQSWASVRDITHSQQLDTPEQAIVLAHLRCAREQLDEYFAGTRTQFTIPLAAAGTVFQREVWQSLTQIPYGATWSYRDVARHIGRPNAMRAVGLANGRNPISIVVPCHRVIGANGSLTGYGGGIERKQQLLSLESRVAPLV